METDVLMCATGRSFATRKENFLVDTLEVVSHGQVL
jgi:hypothetical protein